MLRSFLGAETKEANREPARISRLARHHSSVLLQPKLNYILQSSASTRGKLSRTLLLSTVMTWREKIEHKMIFICLFVCMFVCLQLRRQTESWPASLSQPAITACFCQPKLNYILQSSASARGKLNRALLLSAVMSKREKIEHMIISIYLFICNQGCKTRTKLL